MTMKKEMTRYAFISHMEDYMRKLLKDPLHADTDDFLKEYGIDGPKAIKMLTKRADPDDENSAVVLISKSIKDNGTDENGKRRSDSFVVKCRIPRKDYTKKMRNLYINLFESNIVDKCPINERVTSPDEGLKLMKIKLKKPCDYYKRMTEYVPLLNEGAWGYDPMDNDTSLDFQHEMIKKDCLPNIIRKVKTIDDEWTWLGPVIFLLNSYKDTEVAFSDIYKEACDLCLKGCDNLMKNEDFIKSWDDEEKIKKALEHTKKRVNELISKYEEETSKTKSGGTTPEELNEDGESAGATSADASGQYVQPLFEKSIIRRTIYLTQEQVDYIKKKMNEEAVMDTAFGNFGFDAPIGDGKKNKGNKFFKDANEHNSIMAKSWPKQ